MRRGGSANNASHPRNRPPGAEPAFEVDPAVAARMIAGLKVLAAGSRAASAPARRPAGRRGGNPAAGHRASMAEKRQAHERYEQVRAGYLRDLGRPVANELEREFVSAVAAREASKVCRWW